MRAAIRSGVKSFIFGGSLMVYRDTPEGINQDTPATPASGYGQAKLEAEQRLNETAAAAGMRFVSLRLPHVYGAHSLLFDQVRHGRIFFPGKADNPFAHLHIADTASALIHAADSDMEGVWVIADDQPCTWNEFFKPFKPITRGFG